MRDRAPARNCTRKRGLPLHRPQDTFSRRGVALISAAESLDTSSAGGRLVVNVLGAVAQWEREATAERTSAALQVLKQQGRATGGGGALRVPVHRRAPGMAPGRAGNPRSHHRAPRRRPLMGEGGRPAQRHRAPYSYRRPVDAPGRPPGPSGARFPGRRSVGQGGRSPPYTTDTASQGRARVEGRPTAVRRFGTRSGSAPLSRSQRPGPSKCSRILSGGDGAVAFQLGDKLSLASMRAGASKRRGALLIRPQDPQALTHPAIRLLIHARSLVRLARGRCSAVEVPAPAPSSATRRAGRRGTGRATQQGFSVTRLCSHAGVSITTAP